MRPLSMREAPPPDRGYGGCFLRLWYSVLHVARLLPSLWIRSYEAILRLCSRFSHGCIVDAGSANWRSYCVASKTESSSGTSTCVYCPQYHDRWLLHCIVARLSWGGVGWHLHTGRVSATYLRYVFCKKAKTVLNWWRTPTPSLRNEVLLSNWQQNKTKEVLRKRVEANRNIKQVIKERSLNLFIFAECQMTD